MTTHTIYPGPAEARLLANPVPVPGAGVKP